MREFEVENVPNFKCPLFHVISKAFALIWGSITLPPNKSINKLMYETPCPETSEAKAAATYFKIHGVVI